MTKEERFKMDMVAEFKQMCKIVEEGGRIIVNKQRMLKALEKESVLDKIRAEIEEEIEEIVIPYTGGDMRNILDADKVLEIIDEYKAESGGKE